MSDCRLCDAQRRAQEPRAKCRICGHEYIIVRTPEQVELLLAQWRDEDA